MHKILIYNDKGSGLVSLKQLINCFQTIYGKKIEIIQVNSSYILSGQLNKQKNDSKIILCFGGGYDLGYLELLGETGCNEIRKFVQSGGYYLGICAGAYFATDCIEFNLNGPLEVKGERYLKFFDGKAIGPLNNFKYSDFDDNAIASKIKLTSNELTYYAYLNGGCHFEPALNELNNSSKIIALYENETNEVKINQSKIAIVECEFGLGKCLLSGVHFEFDAYLLNFKDEISCLEMKHKLTEANKKSAESLSIEKSNNNDTNNSHSNYNLVKYLFNKSFNLI